MSDLIRREDALALRDKLADIIGALPMSSIYSALSEYRNAIRALPAVQPDALIAERDEALECNEEFFVDNQILRERVAKAEAEREQLKAKIRFLERRALD